MSSLSPSVSRLPPDLLVVLVGVTAALQVGKLPPALPYLREALGVTLLQAGFLLSLVQLAGMSLGLLLGLTADGLGLRRSLLAGLALLAVAGVLGGAAGSAGELLLWRAVEGGGFLLASLPAPSLIRRLVAPQLLSRRLGLWGAYMPTGAALALLCGPWVMEAAGWRLWWWLLSAWTALMAFWVWSAVPPDPPRTVPADRPQAGGPAGAAGTTRTARTTGMGGPGAEPGAAPGVAPGVAPGWARRLRCTLGSPGPWLVALSFAAYSSQWLAVVGFLPTLYAQAGLAGPVAGALTALVSAANIVGNVGAGRLLWRGWSAPRLLVIGFSVMALGAWAAFATLPAGTGSAALPLHPVPSLDWVPVLGRYVAVLAFSAVGGLIPGALFSLAVRLAPDEHSVSTTVGWVQQCSSLGQFAGPPLVAWMAAQSGGWQSTWQVTGAASLAGLALAAAIAARLRRSSAQRSD